MSFNKNAISLMFIEQKKFTIEIVLISSSRFVCYFQNSLFTKDKRMQGNKFLKLYPLMS